MRQVKSAKRPYTLRARAETQARTRTRIVQATMELHHEVGPARTAVAEIARRAGVQRMTVYNHFPEESDLFRACQAHWMELHPFPDVAAILGRPDQLRAVLAAVYGWYRETAAMVENVQRDRGAVPALDELLRGTADATLDELARVLAASYGDRGAAAVRRRALCRLALDFWTWRRLGAEGLGGRAAANAMAAAVSSGGSGA